MSPFTVVIIIWVIYKLITSVIKKSGIQQTQGIPRGTWREQLKQAMENGSYQAGPLELRKPKDFEESKDDFVETEASQSLKGTQGTEETSEYLGILGAEAYKKTDEASSQEMVRNAPDQRSLSGVHLSLGERELVQGVMWAQILGKPRAMHPYRGPRT